MKRRGFFGLLGAVAVGSVGRADAQLTAPPSPADVARVRGYPSPSSPRTGGGGAYRYHWTGLKSGLDNAWMCGQWLAWPTPDARGVYRYDPDVRPPYLYVNVPGFVGGVYHPGHSFSIVSRDRFILPGTHADQIHGWIAEGELYLRELMETYSDLKASKVRALLYHFPLDAESRRYMETNAAL